MTEAAGEAKIEISAPSWMTRRQKLLWRKTIEGAPPDLLLNMDSGLLANWVIACDTHREACEQSKKAGLIVRSPVKGVPMQNPYLPIINRQAEIMMRAASKLGFTPTSPLRVQRNKAPELGKKDQKLAAAKTVGSGKFGSAPPPKLVVNNR